MLNALAEPEEFSLFSALAEPDWTQTCGGFSGFEAGKVAIMASLAVTVTLLLMARAGWFEGALFCMQKGFVACNKVF